MIDGPGPPGTDTVAVRALPASVALMTRFGAADVIRDTQRILLVLSCSGGACSASRGAHRIATMLPAAPITWGMARSGGVNPDRAQAGSGLTGGCPMHPFEAAGTAALAWATACGLGCPATPAATPAAAPSTAATAAPAASQRRRWRLRASLNRTSGAASGSQPGAAVLMATPPILAR